LSKSDKNSFIFQSTFFDELVKALFASMGKIEQFCCIT